MAEEEACNDLVVEIEYYNHRICTPAWTIIEQRIRFVDVTYIIRGSAEYMINGEKVTASAGDLLCIQAGSLRSAASHPDNLMECYSVNGRVSDVSGKEMEMPLPLLTQIGMQQDIINLYQDLNATWLLRDPGYVMRARALYMIILHRYFQLILYKDYAKNHDNRIQKVLRYIINHYSEPLTVSGMAEMAGLSSLYFGNFFRQETGLTFKQYLTSIRLNHAEDMLASGEYNVNEVAEACGFPDIYYFSKIFKKNRGISPSMLIYSGKK
ncbi:MAG: AraC family transcriptional regulator [Clostridiales bacterium]|jgi:AraC-like DNA-binding protein|nr:AraC family transcriptional regulator [Clostridiales bacterium]